MMLSAASQAGAWCAVVGLPALSPIAAEEVGIRLERFGLVPEPGPDWGLVVAVFVDGVDVVVVGAGEAPSAALCGRLGARARQRGAVIVLYGGWHGADLTLSTTGAAWEGLQQGRGRLQCREVSVVARGRGAAATGWRVTAWLPGPSGLYAELRAGRVGATGSRRLVAVPAGGSTASGSGVRLEVWRGQRRS